MSGSKAFGLFSDVKDKQRMGKKIDKLLKRQSRNEGGGG